MMTKEKIVDTVKNIPFVLILLFVFCTSIYAGVSNLIKLGYIGAYITFTEPIGINCTHYAVLIAVSTVYSLNVFFDKRNGFRRSLSMCMLLYFGVLLLIITSRTAILTTFLIGVVFVIKEGGKRLLWIPAIVFVVSVAGLNSSEWGRVRIETTIMRFESADIETILPYRLPIYITAIEVISEKKWFGYGKKNTQSILNERYKQKGLTHPLKHNYHSHNQYLQYALYGGFFLASLLFFISLILPVLSSDRILMGSTMVLFNMTFMTDAPLVDPFVFLGFYLIVVGGILSILIDRYECKV